MSIREDGKKAGKEFEVELFDGNISIGLINFWAGSDGLCKV